MKFLLDENVHHGLIPILRKGGHAIELSPKGITNGKVLALATAQKRILITHDKDFAERMLPENHWGIILVRIPSKKLDLLASRMKNLLASKQSASDFASRLIFLSEDGWLDFSDSTVRFPKS